MFSRISETLALKREKIETYGKPAQPSNLSLREWCHCLGQLKNFLPTTQTGLQNDSTVFTQLNQTHTIHHDNYTPAFWETGLFCSCAALYMLWRTSPSIASNFGPNSSDLSLPDSFCMINQVRRPPPPPPRLTQFYFAISPCPCRLWAVRDPYGLKERCLPIEKAGSLGSRQRCGGTAHKFCMFHRG